jgi:tetratricopeptide (TPR) repeat protein
MFEEAVRRDPSYSDAYAGLADVYAAMGDLDKARESIQRALDQGIDANSLALSRANIAFRANDLNQLRQLMNAHLSGENVTVDDVLRWTNFLVTRNLFDEALAAVNMAQPSMEGESQTTLRIEEARVLARSGSVEDAAAILDEVEPQVAADELLKSTWSSARLELAQMYLQAGGSDNIARARAIVEPIRNGGDPNSFADLLFAEILSRATPPNPGAARELLDSLLARDSGNVRALLAASSVATSQGQLKRHRHTRSAPSKNRRLSFLLISNWEEYCWIEMKCQGLGSVWKMRKPWRRTTSMCCGSWPRLTCAKARLSRRIARFSGLRPPRPAAPNSNAPPRDSGANFCVCQATRMKRPYCCGTGMPRRPMNWMRPGATRKPCSGRTTPRKRLG